MNGSDSPACGSSDVGIAEQAAYSQPQIIDETASDTDTSSSGEEEDEEPRLKYSRLALSEDVFAKDQASALAVSDRILVRTWFTNG